jgi:DegV family protein with EDD domain
MAHIRIVTDSTADIRPTLREKHHIEMVPLNVHFDQDTYEDQVTLDPISFYQKLATFDGIPRTSQPAPGQFLAVYERIFSETPDITIVTFLLSSALSGTYQSAHIARSMLPDDVQDRVILVDTKSASVGIHVAVIAFAEAIEAGTTLSESLAIAQHILDKQSLFFLVDTLTYLHRNGRIGGAAAFVGSLLQVKPILSLTAEGSVYSFDKARGTAKAMRRIFDELHARIAEQPTRFAIAHADAASEAEQLAEQLRNTFGASHIEIMPCGPVIGVHVGPGTLAVVAYP